MLPREVAEWGFINHKHPNPMTSIPEFVYRPTGVSPAITGQTTYKATHGLEKYPFTGKEKVTMVDEMAENKTGNVTCTILFYQIH